MLPQRMGVQYRDEANDCAVPVILHHAVLGSLERFIGMLLEHYEGQLPLWLAPEQIVIASIGAAQADYAGELCRRLAASGWRAALDDGKETLARKIAAAHEAGIPLVGVVGAREASNGSIALRYRNGAQESLPVEAAMAKLGAAIAGPPWQGGQDSDRSCV